MSSGIELEHIDAVDAFARTLFVRVENHPSPLFTEVGASVRRLHLALRHLRVEAADPDSLLRSADASVYARQLRPIVEDCDFALKQLKTILEKFDGAGGRETDGLVDRIAAVRSRLANETTSVDMFLDTVQLNNPANNAPEVVPQGSDSNLENIKDKVDNIAARLFRRWNANSGIMNDEDSMWQEFKSELEMEGFSPHILHQHKEVLRAYIRELQAMSPANGGSPPTVRGLLEHEAAKRPPPLPPKAPLSPKELYSSCVENEKCFPSIKQERRMPDHAPVAGASGNENRSFSDDGSAAVGGSLALISTKDLMNMDRISAEMALMHLKPSSSHLGAPDVRSNPGLTPPGMSGSWPPPHMSTGQSNLPNSVGGSPNIGFLQTGYLSASRAQPGSFSSSPGLGSRLAPDRYGKEIPMDAPWTKIRRSLVSPEVLQRAGVRYEARPEYVAVLGRLSREQIEEYARQSAACRAARSGGYPPAQRQDRYAHRDRADSKSSREDNDDESVLWDESDATDLDDATSKRGQRNYPYIVSPPNEDNTSPSSTVMPKPILKNKNENRVRFDPEPHEVDIKSSKPYDDGYIRRRENDSRRNRDHRDSGKREERPRGDDNRHRYPNRSEHGRRRNRRDERHMRRKTWGETIGAVSIGGAAASLLGVLTEAAVGF
ncbi:hypothetical protein J3458_000960 [Metarhizium acridum]|uniref:DUF8035 domain-containing protein n=1 Tax=Metarhizium acridum (strain CQMa 102) TaxID=655827 RepID=E9DVG8_METAQ|nr:uncharacterized protein MAC_01616 [Metarhizium acridum CQMa 102]EFY92345.1 hypothetical protein MAC_01616 [Metarhizium acridum CQMa 102]KAG8424132.1 hypothetical protein J3458_000960 [Metarhizium acridum]